MPEGVVVGAAGVVVAGAWVVVVSPLKNSILGYNYYYLQSDNLSHRKFPFRH